MRTVACLVIGFLSATSLAQDLKPCSKNAIMMGGQFTATQKVDKGLYVISSAVDGGGIDYQGRTYQLALASTTAARGFDTNAFFKMYRSIAGRFEITGTKEVTTTTGFPAKALLLEECKK